MEKKLSDKDFTSQDLLQMLHEKYKTPWKHEEIEAHMHNLSTDEILDEMIMVYRDNSLPWNWRDALFYYLRLERWQRYNEEFKLTDSNRAKIIEANQKIIDAAKALKNDYAQIFEARSKGDKENMEDYIVGYVEWWIIDKNYNFGYSHPIDERQFRELSTIIYGEHDKEVHAGFGGFGGAISKRGAGHDDLDNLVYPRHPDSPEEERSWNKLMGLEEFTDARLCYPFWTMKDSMLTLDDIYAIQKYQKIVEVCNEV